MGNIAYSYNHASVWNQKRTLAPNTVVVNWTTGGLARTLTDNGAGKLTGSGGGSVSYATGLIFLAPDPAPIPSDGSYTVTFEDWDGITTQNGSIPLMEAGSTTYQAPGPMRKGSVSIRLSTSQISKRYEKLDPANYNAPRIITDSYKNASVLLTDDGAGGLRRQKDGPVIGSVNYATGAVTLDPRQSYSFNRYTEYGRMDGSSYYKTGTGTATETYTGVTASITWDDPADPLKVNTTTFPIEGLTIDLTPTSGRKIYANSILFEIAGVLYRDQDGAIIKGWSPITNTGTAVGSIDYTTGLVTLNDYPANTPTSAPVNLIACLTSLEEEPATQTMFRTAGAPLREGSLIVSATDIDGNKITLNAETSGTLTGGPSRTDAFVDTQTGLVTIRWGKAIQPSTVRYSAVSYTYLPLDASLVGLDATRLPSDGRVPQFNLGDVVVISNTKQHPILTATAGQVVDFLRVNQAEVWIMGANGNRLAANQYALNTDTGTLTFATPLTLIDSEAAAVTEPLTIHERVEDMGLATDVQIGGQVSLNIPLSQDYTAGDTIASAALLYGDLRARAHNAFHQKSWTSAWDDKRVGDDTTAKYNLVSYPLEVTNQGAIKERWSIRFTSSTSFDVIGETVGVVANGSTAADLAPTNAATGAPYFTIRATGWGSGWVSGNTLRFNTDGGQAPFWVARTIVAGRATEEEDQFATQNRGDAD